MQRDIKHHDHNHIITDRVLRSELDPPLQHRELILGLRVLGKEHETSSAEASEGQKIEKKFMKEKRPQEG